MGARGSSRSARRVSSRSPRTKCLRDRSREPPGAIEIAQRQTSCRIGSRCGEWPFFVELDGDAFAYAAPDAVYILVMHKGEEPGAEAGAALPAMLHRNRADEGVLDEIVGPRHVAGQRTSIASQARDFLFEKPTEIVHLGRLCSGQSTSRILRLSEGRRRNLDYGEAQSFQDLLLCGSLRLIGDELHAGLTGSSRIPV